MEVLVERGIIPSGDVLAEVLPQITAGVRSAGIGEPQLRQLYAAVYRAFRRRRSLLLLDLQGQVKIDEMPWVEAIEAFRDDTPSTQHVSQQVLEEVACLTLTSFPQTILPNKLLQQIRALAKGAGIEVPIVDELAADIFMGEFSPRFTVAAKLAASGRPVGEGSEEYALELLTSALRAGWIEINEYMAQFGCDEQASKKKARTQRRCAKQGRRRHRG